MNYKILSSCKLVILLLLMSIGSLAWAQQVVVDIDRSQVNEGESFQVTFTVKGDADNLTPDFSPITKDFIMMGKSRSSQVTIINNKTTTITQWMLSLAAKTTGKLTIPAINFGPFTSNALPIQVLAAGANNSQGKKANAFIQISIDNPAPYVQSQIMYTVKLFYAVSITNGNLTDPIANDAIIMRLGSDQRYQARRNGRIYQVLERNYAIFPQHSGSLEIAAPVFTGLTNIGRNSFGGFNPLMQGGEPLRLSSKTETLSVKPIPKDVDSNNWLPAKNLQIQESWSDNLNDIQVGKPITRTIIITANGLAAAQLPTLSFNNGDGYNVYPDKPQLSNALHDNQVQGKIIQKIAYIPTKSGELRLPALRITWWNTNTSSLSTSALPARKLFIAGNSHNTADNNQTATSPQATASTKPAISTANDMTSTEKTSAPVNHQDDSWFIIAIIFAVAWLLTLFIWFKTRGKLKQPTSGDDENYSARYFQSVKRLRIAIKNACVKQQKEKTRDLLLQWANTVWPEKSLKSLGALAKHLGACPLAQQIKQLDKILYAESNETWQSKKLFSAFDEYNPDQHEKKRRSDNALPPLYPAESRTS